MLFLLDSSEELIIIFSHHLGLFLHGLMVLLQTSNLLLQFLLSVVLLAIEVISLSLASQHSRIYLGDLMLQATVHGELLVQRRVHHTNLLELVLILGL